MAKTPSTMLPLQTVLPAFVLPRASASAADGLGAPCSSAAFAGRPLVVMFICNHCPYVQHLRQDLAAFGATYQARGMGVVAINSNDVQAYPADAPPQMAQELAAAGYTFPYLFDADQQVARAFAAACTPDFYLFDAAHRLAYRGQYDSSRPGNGQPVDGADLRQACDAVLAAQSPSAVQHPSVGCGIKWRAGTPPAESKAPC